MAVVIPLWRADGVFAGTAKGLAEQCLKPVQVIIVDNGESALAMKIVQEQMPEALVIHNTRNLGFATAANQGIVAADAPYVCLLNQDCRLAPDYLERVVGVLENHTDAFAASGLILDENGKVDSAGHAFYRDRVAVDIRVAPADSERIYEVWGLPATAVVYRRATLFGLAPSLHPFDPLFFSYLEDVDLNYRAQALGYKSLVVPSAIAHHSRASSGGRKLFAIRWRAHKNFLFILAKYETATRLWRDLPDLYPQLMVHIFQSLVPNPLYLISDLQLILFSRHILKWRRWYRERAKHDPLEHPLTRTGRWLREPLKVHPGSPLSS